MQLSERGIEQLITSLVGVWLQYATNELPEPEEWPIARIFNMDKAAHAIAERMREGVVLETKDAWLPPSATHKGILWIAGDEHSPAVMTGGLPTIMEGKECVTVTVTKEEKDADS